MFLSRFDSLVHAALGFLSAICQRPHYASYFEGEGVLKTICESVIVQNLLLRGEDTDMYEQEPFDYLKKDIEGEWPELKSSVFYRVTDQPFFRF
jgi:exportin-2 (importin alpha re-exporter)